MRCKTAGGNLEDTSNNPKILKLSISICAGFITSLIAIELLAGAITYTLLLVYCVLFCQNWWFSQSTINLRV